MRPDPRSRGARWWWVSAHPPHIQHIRTSLVYDDDMTVGKVMEAAAIVPSPHFCMLSYSHLFTPPGV